MYTQNVCKGILTDAIADVNAAQATRAAHTKRSGSSWKPLPPTQKVVLS